MDGKTPDDPALSHEEATLLLLVARGQSTSKVARTLAISESTMRRRLTSLQRKLGANSRINAVYLAAKSGLI